MQALENALQYHFRRPELLRQALRLPSMGGPDNQRMEFLGDAVLELLVSDLLYRRYPAEQEGELTARRQALVCEETLSHLARELGLPPALQLSHGDELTGVREKPSTLCDAFEAVLAAIYLDGGIASAAALVQRIFEDDEKLARMRGRDVKGLLQAFAQGCGLPLPEYRIVEESGPAHLRHFVAEVSVSGEVLSRGEGGTKKAAEQAAAAAALESCRNQHKGENE